MRIQGWLLAVASNVPGTVIPFYCQIHKQMRVPAHGHVPIR